MLFRHPWPHPTKDELRRMAKLLVIDDQEFEYKALFEEEGYTVVKWDDAPNLQRLETSEFHVVLLDLKGIGRNFSSSEGAGLIDHIRETNPAQIIIAYTNARHNFAHQHFLDKADYRIPKSEDFSVFKRRVDESLERRFSEDFYFTRLSEVLTAPGYELSASLRRKAAKAIRTRNSEGFRQGLKKLNIDAQTIDRALTVCSIASNVLLLVGVH
jgi:DNA-binding NarL/FixJ family response regulator